MSLARMLMAVGLILTAAGGLLWLAGRLGLRLGGLPGDIVYRRGGFTFYFPLATCILLSALLSLVLWLLRRR